MQKVSKYGQKMRQEHTADRPTTPLGRAKDCLQSHDIKRQLR